MYLAQVVNMGGKAGWGGETLKWSKAYRLRFSCASAFAHSFKQLFKEDCQLVYLCPSGTLEQWNQWSCPSHLHPLLCEKKKDKGKEKKKKKERPFALTEGYFLLHCFWKSEKRTVFYTWPSGRYQVNILRTPSFQVNNPYISVGCKTHLQKRLSITWDTQAQKNNIWHCWCWLPPNIKRKKVVLKSEIFGYLWIIDWRYYQSSDFLLIFSKVFVLLENQEFRNFLIVLYKR